MLVLTRKAEQRIQIGNNIVITILHVKGNAVSVGIEAPREIRVMRGEIAAKSLLAERVSEASAEPAPNTEPTQPSQTKGFAATPQGVCATLSRHALPTDSALGGHVLRRRAPNASLLPSLTRPQSRLAPASPLELLVQRS